MSRPAGRDAGPAGLRVALLNPCYWPEVRRGSERFARELADGLIARGHSPRLITSVRGLPSRKVEDGLEVVRVWRPPDGRLRHRVYEEHLTHVPFSYAALRAGSDDIAHALYPTDGLAAVRWGERTGRPVVFSHMGIPHRQGLASRRRRVEILQRVIAGSDAVVALRRPFGGGLRAVAGRQAAGHRAGGRPEGVRAGRAAGRAADDRLRGGDRPPP